MLSLSEKEIQNIATRLQISQEQVNAVIIEIENGGSIHENSHKVQREIVFEFLKENIATVSMVAAATGINQKYITLYKRELEKAGRLWKLAYKTCKISRRKARYLTTDKAKSPNRFYQSKLF